MITWETWKQLTEEYRDNRKCGINTDEDDLMFYILCMWLPFISSVTILLDIVLMPIEILFILIKRKIHKEE